MTTTPPKRRLTIVKPAKRWLAPALWVLGGTTASANSLTVNSLADTALAGDGQCTLREAIHNANADIDASRGDCNTGAGADTITFGLSGVISLGSTLNINAVDGLSLDGANQKVTLNGNHTVRVLQVNEAATLNLNNLTIINGYADASGFGGTLGGGGAIHNQYGVVNIANSTLAGNTSAGSGGAIVNTSNDALANPGGRLTIVNSTFVGNSAFTGGAIANVGTASVSVLNSTLVANSAVTPLCTANFCATIISQGGGIANASLGAIRIDNSIAAGNTNIIKSPSGDLIAASDLDGYGFSGTYNLIGSPNGMLGGLQDGIDGNRMGYDVNAVVSSTLADNGGVTQTLALLAASPALDSANPGNCPGADQRGIIRPQGSGCDIGAFETQIAPNADLAVSGQFTPNPLMVRDQFNALLSVVNNGPDQASDVTLTDTLPAGAANVTATSGQGKCGPFTAGKVICNLGVLPAGSAINITLKGVIANPGVLSNVANVGGTQLDKQIANNTARQTVNAVPLSCQGLTPTIVGTPGNDTLRGTGKRDVIQALSGNDTIYGADGDDVLCGGEGNDSLKGEKGNDKLDGGAYVDSCDGAAGTDSATNCEAVTGVP